MKRIAIGGFFCLVLALALAAGLAIPSIIHGASTVIMEKNALPVIVVDAGHGGIDGGAVAADGTEEKHINLSIAQKTANLLATCGFNVIMTRTEDTLISDSGASTIRQKKKSDLYNRLKLIERYPNAVLLSIHQNMFSQSRYSGTQVFYSTNHSESKQLANNIQQTVVRLMQPENTRQTKPVGSEIYLLDHTQTIAVMVECGFLSNIQELNKLKNDQYQDQMAFAIVCSLLGYYATESAGSS